MAKLSDSLLFNDLILVVTIFAPMNASNYHALGDSISLKQLLSTLPKLF